MTLSQNDLIIIGKYFEDIYDYINLIKTCKKYEDILKLYRTNFIPIYTENEFDLFENLETYNLYYNYDFKPLNLKTVNYELIPLTKIKQNENENIIYKNIKLDRKLNVENLTLDTTFSSISSQCNHETLQSIILPYSITELNSYCFYKCENLTNVDLSMCVELKEIPDECFGECKKLENIKLPINITSLGFESFYECESLTSIDLSMCEKLKEINNECFCECTSLKYVKLPKNIKKLNDKCFMSCLKLESINLDNIVEIGEFCFCGCISLKNVKLNENVKLGLACFEDCEKLESINLDNIVEISNACFYGCTSLKYVKLNENVKLGLGCFEHCENLINIGIKLETIVSVGPRDLGTEGSHEFSQNLESIKNIEKYFRYCYKLKS